MNRDLVAACKRAKVPRTTPHDLRRTYADPSPDELAATVARQVKTPRRPKR